MAGFGFGMRYGDGHLRLFVFSKGRSLPMSRTLRQTEASCGALAGGSGACDAAKNSLHPRLFSSPSRPSFVKRFRFCFFPSPSTSSCIYVLASSDSRRKVGMGGYF